MFDLKESVVNGLSSIAYIDVLVLNQTNTNYT